VASFVFIAPPLAAQALDPLEASANVLATEGGKAALIEIVKFAKSKQSLGFATMIVCGSCITMVAAPVVTTITGIACGLLLGKFLR
jgi:hypothetical protein